MTAQPAETLRVLTRRQAASYCSLTVAGLLARVRTGKLPPTMPGTRRWVRRALDRLSGIDIAQGRRLSAGRLAGEEEDVVSTPKSERVASWFRRESEDSTYVDRFLNEDIDVVESWMRRAGFS